MLIDLGRLLLIMGGLLLVVGLVLTVAGRIPGLGNLPSDIAIERGNFRLYAPIGTMIVVSLVLTVILNIVMRFFR
jgi:hypothetical protein